MSAPELIGLVPMRHTSERVPGKNYRDLSGRPLYHYVVQALMDSGVVDEIVIDTDSPTITEDARRCFPQVRVIPRPTHLLGGEVPMNDVLLHDLTQAPAELYLQTHSTNPLLRPETIRDAVQRLRACGAEHDSLFGVTPLRTRLWWADARAVNHDPEVLLRTQDLPPIFEENSNLYVFPPDVLRRRGNRIGDRPLLYSIPREEAWDIDDELDWTVVESLLARRGAV